MKDFIRIGNDFAKTDAELIAKALVALLTAINENKIDREVAIKALEVFAQTSEIKNIEISGNTFFNKTPEQPKLTEESESENETA